MLIRDIPPGERPMERLARLGPQALRDVELLAILLGGQTALDAAETALEDGLARLQNRTRIPQLSEIRQARIIAVLELARRIEALREKPARVVLRAKDVAPHLIAKYSHEPQERLGVILLDSRQRILAEREVFIGQHDRVYVSHRSILKHALIEDADAIIIFHNHPTGDPEPSPEDARLTADLKAACVSMHIVLFDHIVIGRGRYFSFREARRL